MHTLEALRAGELAGVTRLDLSCGLREFPREIFELADSLEILNLSGNALSELPDDLPRLHKLRVIFCSDNRFTHVPEVLGRCTELEMVGFKANQIETLSAAALPTKLRWLILTDNRLRELPPEIGRCTRMQKLMLAGNQLQQLPDELTACRNLELLRIAANRFEHLPDWLFDMPRLAWLACSGNPCSDINEAAALEHLHITPIEWHQLELHHQLGEGASGVIYRAHHQEKDAPVAVKMFKGALTSDGLPRSEKAASIAAGAHPGLIPVIGKISEHPEQTPGLVMSLIDPAFRNLAGPPSLASCTRDIYADDVRFKLPVALNIARGIAAVAEHLHAQCIMHGDLYAHNILWDNAGDCLLGDFGAASFLPQDAQQAEAMQRIEVRAFACLLDELITRCKPTSENAAILNAMRALQQRCDSKQVRSRPLFADIHRQLEKIARRIKVRRDAPSKEDIALMEPFVGLPLERIHLPTTPDGYAAATAEIMAAGIIGFDTESKPTFAAGDVSDGPHVLQFALHDKAYLFQIHRKDCYPFLIEMLQSPQLLKVGFGLSSDSKHIRNKLGIQPGGLVDLNQVFSKDGFQKEMGVRSAVAQMFKQRFIKSRKVTTSNWALHDLNDQQMLYAANDAFAALKVLEALQLAKEKLPIMYADSAH
ncbi:MAG: protein kinase [Gammaproteobacteria bacterium]|nr:protein kinase [Gammaproteobacteria bacterium]MBU1625439.1 protein kinase [Gammaproteobacteria bacterium]MBU1981699.1 protein kinase [Gammaproteobacteria bacterium]